MPGHDSASPNMGTREICPNLVGAGPGLVTPPDAGTKAGPAARDAEAQRRPRGRGNHRAGFEVSQFYKDEMSVFRKSIGFA